MPPSRLSDRVQVCRPERSAGERAQFRGDGRDGPPVPGDPDSQERPCPGLTLRRAGTPPQAIAHPAASSEAPASGWGAGRWEAGAAPPAGSSRRLAVSPWLRGAPCRRASSDLGTGGWRGGSPGVRERRGARPVPPGRCGPAGGPAGWRWALRPGRSPRLPPEP